MTYDQILRDLRQKTFQPIYFLHGLESYFIDSLSDFFEAHVLTEAEKAFNLTIFYGKETDYLNVVDAARRYPMMSARQLIIVKEAQEMKTLSSLQKYIEQPLNSTILVLCYKHKKLNLNTKFGKSLKSHTLVFESKKLYDNQVPDWIRNYLSSNKINISDNASALLTEYLGNDLSKIVNELNKLRLNIQEGTKITTEHIEKHIGISKDFNIFEMQRALSKRNIQKANRIMNYFIANPRKNPMVLVVGALYNFFSKVYMLHFLKTANEKEVLKTLKLRSSFFLKEYRAATHHFNRTQTEATLQLLKEYDLKSKGVKINTTNTPGGELLKELIFKILHT